MSTPISAPVFVSCACGARYDVSSREEGQRVRCRRCGVAIVVPAGRARPGGGAPSRTASERLLRAHGTACDGHSRSLAVAVCERCGRAACQRCLAPEPCSHLCEVCAEIAQVRPVLPVDWGIGAVLGNALRAWGRALGPRIVLYNLLAFATVITLFCCAMGPLLIVRAHVDAAVDDLSMRAFWVAVLRAAGCVVILATGALLAVLSSGGNATFLDGALRGETITLGHAIYRCVRRAPSIAVAWGLVVLALVAPLFAIEVPFVAAAAVTGKTWLAFAGLVPYAPIALVVLSSVVLAGPVAILEDRSGARAVGRAIELARGHRGSMAALLVIFSIVWGAVTAGTSLLGGAAFQPVAFAISLAIAILLDIGWSSLLVAAYHGLAAGKLGLIGRH